MLSIELEGNPAILDCEIVDAVNRGKDNLSRSFYDIYESATAGDYKNLMKFELLVNCYQSFKTKLSLIDNLSEHNNIDELKDLFFDIVSDQAFIQGISQDLSCREHPVSLIVDDRNIFTVFNDISNGMAQEDTDDAYKALLEECSNKADERIYNLIDLICNWDISCFEISEKLESMLSLDEVCINMGCSY